MGAEPRPASLEKTPRPTPLVMASFMVTPTAPPTTAEGLNAPWKMLANTPGIVPALAITTTSAQTM